MTITAEMVKTLREMTGAGMMECKSALVETAGDIEAAVDRLKARGTIKAAKKAGRVASEGLVCISVSEDGTAASIVEINSETDFVARNETFQALVEGIAAVAQRTEAERDVLLAEPYPGTGRTVAEEVTNAVATIGEHIELRRVAPVSVVDGVVASYVHNAVKPGMGRLGVLVALESNGDRGVLNAVGRQIAMHIANTKPLAIAPTELDPELVERERRIFREQAAASGKPAEIVEKMVEGRLRKFYEESTLLAQTSVIDGKTRISDVLENAEKEAGAPISLTAFAFFGVGDGIEGPDDEPNEPAAAAAA